MSNNPVPKPRPIHGVMISSTFTDLEEHRSELAKALRVHGLTEIAMENTSANPNLDVIDASLKLVQDAYACISLISRKYGQTPECNRRNPNKLSITELEYNKAFELPRPILLFVMGEKHLVHEADIETNRTKKAKLKAFRERAKKMHPDSNVHRIHVVFNSLKEFTDKVHPAIANLRRYLDEIHEPAIPVPPSETEKNRLPIPPALYAEPHYIGSHKFTGRQDQLNTLSDWATPADAYPILLFDAIGGTGKSMLTWEWTTKHAIINRTDWAGRFWYSFYERGAVMADFCRRALAYITQEPLQTFNKIKTSELGERLLHELQTKPWLLVLDGLERILVAYDRIDAAELADEDVDQATDQIAKREICDAIRPEDDELLRSLAAAAPSKLLITTRLVPRVLLNPSNQPIPGVQRVSLPGLRPVDAESLVRSCGVTGNSQEIQSYLKTNCDCHPLTTGILAGLINNYLPDRGNFDAWSADTSEGGHNLNLANLNLVQKRNHILKASINTLAEHSRRLLSMLALLSGSVDYTTIKALITCEPKLLADMIRDIEQRGLLQYDHASKLYDLHPVVRGIAAGQLETEDKQEYGQLVVDYFSARPHNPYADAETLDDVRDGLRVVHTLLKIGRFQQAYDAYEGEFSESLLFNLRAYAEVLSLLKPFFPAGWGVLPSEVDDASGGYLANVAAIALEFLGHRTESLSSYTGSLAGDLRRDAWRDIGTKLRNLSDSLTFAQGERCLNAGLELARLAEEEGDIFVTLLCQFELLARNGQWARAANTWSRLDGMGRNWPRHSYRPGDAESDFALFRFYQGTLSESELTKAKQLSREGRNAGTITNLSWHHGEWLLEKGEWLAAIDQLSEALAMSRKVGLPAPTVEARLALAKFKIGQLPNPTQEAERLETTAASHALADLWFAIGNSEKAQNYARAAYKWAWADGEPYVHRYYLNKAKALLEKLNVPIPNLPPYDPTKAEKYPLEDEVNAAVERLRAQKAAEKTPKKSRRANASGT